MLISRAAFKNPACTPSTLCTVLALTITSLLAGCGSGGGGGSTTPPPPTTYTVGGTLTGLAAGNSITLTDNGSDNLKLTANGTFTFATPLVNAAAYSLTIAATTPTVQPCTSIYGEGTVNAANVTILNVFCGLPGGAGTFSTTGSLVTAREGHTATVLPSGNVLVSGGYGGIGINLTSAEIYDPNSGGWTATGSLATPRNSHTATLLPNGAVMVAGGSNDGALASAELYYPSSGVWNSTDSLATARLYHTATLLLNGDVLVCGGVYYEQGVLDSVLASAELYNPSTGTWTTTGSLATGRSSHTATLLANGKVLVTGGYDTNGHILAGAELYDPSTGTWTTTGSLATARAEHTATLLPNGNVLASGGINGSTVGSILASSELFNPSTGTWSATGSLNVGRYAQTATLLPSGEVLAVGGVNGVEPQVPAAVARAELYDPSTGIWTATGSLTTARVSHTASLLLSGKVLASAGDIVLPLENDGFISSAEVYF